MKKAQGLPMNTIVIAIIVVTVLVVLIMVFTGVIGGWTFSVTSCTDKANHVCMPAETGCGTSYGQVRTSKCYDAEGNIDTSLVCCVKTGTGEGEVGLPTCAQAGGSWVEADKCQTQVTATLLSHETGKVCCSELKTTETQTGGETVCCTEDEGSCVPLEGETCPEDYPKKITVVPS